MIIPRPYQVEGINFLANREKASLWDDPGLGKTIQTLLASQKTGVRKALIVCPASARLVWKKECEKVNIESNVVLRNKDIVPSGVNIVSYEGAVSMSDWFVIPKWDLLTIDEEHYLKGFNTRTIIDPKFPSRKLRVPPKRVEAIFGRKCDANDCLAGNSGMVWGLTGTPMPNDPSELFPMIRAKFPDILIRPNGYIMSYWDFIQKYCKTFDNGYGMQIVGGKNLKHLRQELRGRVMRRKKKDVAKDLPDVTVDDLYVEGDLKNLPEKAVDEIRHCLDSDDPLDALKRSGTHVATVRRLTGIAKVKSVIKWIEESSHDKIVIFAYHKEVIRELIKMKDTVYIDGSCSHDQRNKAVQDFQEGDARCFVGQLKAARESITLTAANVLVFVEYEYTPAYNIQASDRIHRIGQNRNCLVYFATVPNSIDEDIMKVVKRKYETYEEMGL